MESQQLSGRENEVLKLIAQGKSNKEIASELFISVNTVRVHLKHIFQKIGVASRTEAAVYAMEMGIIQSSSEPPKSNFDLVPESYQAKELEPSQWQQIWHKYWWAFALFGIVSFLGLSSLFANTPFFVTTSSVEEPLLKSVNEQRWQQLAPLPLGRASMASLAYDNDIYVIGGETESGVTSLVERYNPETDNWNQQKEKPTAVKDISAVLIGEKFFVPGGLTAEGKPTNVFEVYDPIKNIWERKADLPIPISAYALAAYEGQIYLFGGWDGEKVSDLVLRYDPLTDNWNKDRTMLSARAFAGAAVAGGKIYVAGGWDGNKFLNINESFRPSREASDLESWKIEPTLPGVTEQFTIQSIGDTLVVISKNEDGKSTLMQYSQLDNSWATLSEDFPKPIGQKFGATTIEGSIYLIGGIDDGLDYLSNNLKCKVIFSLFIPNISK